MLVTPTLVSCFKGSTYLLKGETSPEPWGMAPLKIVFATVSEVFQVKFCSQSVVHFHSFFLLGDSLIEIQCMHHVVYPFKMHLKYTVYASSVFRAAQP